MKSDHFDGQRTVARCADDFTYLSNARMRTLRFNEQSDRANDPSGQRRQLGFLQRGETVIERETAI